MYNKIKTRIGSSQVESVLFINSKSQCPLP
jgi:hypothetical protein